MNIEKLQKAYKNLEAIVKESKLSQAHEQSQNMAVGMGIFTLSMPFVATAPYVLAPLALAGGITFWLNMDGLVNLIAYKTDPQKLEPEPIVEWDEEEVNLVQKGFLEISYALKKAENDPKRYLSQQLQYHQQTLVGLKQTTSLFQILGAAATTAEIEAEKTFSLVEEKETKQIIFWQKIKDAPRYWLQGTTQRANLQNFIATFNKGVARLEVLKEFFTCGEEFFAGFSSKPGLSEHSALALEVGKAAQELTYFTERTIQAQKQYRDFHQRIYNLFYPSSQPIHRWLPF